MKEASVSDRGHGGERDGIGSGALLTVEVNGAEQWGSSGGGGSGGGRGGMRQSVSGGGAYDDTVTASASASASASTSTSTSASVSLNDTSTRKSNNKSSPSSEGRPSLTDKAVGGRRTEGKGRGIPGIEDDNDDDAANGDNYGVDDDASEAKVDGSHLEREAIARNADNDDEDPDALPSRLVRSSGKQY